MDREDPAEARGVSARKTLAAGGQVWVAVTHGNTVSRRG